MNGWLYALLPEDIRQADEALAGTPLRVLLGVIEEHADVVRAGIAQQYEDWFIETCAEWAVPYIGELVGYRSPSGTGRETAVPRRDVANMTRIRRRTGTLGVLETIARDVTGWNAVAIEFERSIAATYSPAVRPGARERTLDLRDGGVVANVRDVRSSAARGVAARGIYAVGTIGLIVARSRARSVSRSDAACVTAQGDHCYTFDALGFDVPLVSALQPLPVRLSRHDLVREYGVHKSLAIWTRAATAGAPLDAVPPERLTPADLQHWHFRPKPGQVAVDVERGRLSFAPGHAPGGVAVRYFYRSAADLGAGEYGRDCASSGARFPIGRGGREEHGQLESALAHWKAAEEKRAVLEFGDSHVYDEGGLRIELAPDQSLEIRAEDGTRPIVRFEERDGQHLGGLHVRGGRGSTLTLDGLLIARRGIEIAGDVARVTIRRCTLVPGECPIVVHAPTAELVIEQSIVGDIRTLGDKTRHVPAAVSIADSIIDAQGAGNAIGSPDASTAFVNLRVARSTILGRVRAHSVVLVENAIFDQPLWVRRRDVGCVRFSFLAPQSRTPQGVACVSAPAPTFMSKRFGTPGYGRLAPECAPAITTGAQDQGEMGASFRSNDGHKAGNLRGRIAEFVPPGVRVEIRYVEEV